jgi:thiol-disulfide isomerase/thioredoxin
MYRVLITAIISFAVLFFNKNKSGEFVTVTGTVLNAAGDSVYLKKNNLTSAIPLKNGKFMGTLKLEEAGYFEFREGKSRTQIYLSPGDSLDISADALRFDESLYYGGTAANENNYLAQIVLKQTPYSEDPKAFYSLPADDFRSRVNTLQTQLNQDLETVRVSEDFKVRQRKNNFYNAMISINEYQEFYRYYAKAEPQVSQDFYQELNKVDLYNENDFYRIPNYRNFLEETIATKARIRGGHAEVERIISQVRSQEIKDELLGKVYYQISPSNTDAQEYYGIIHRYAKDTDLLKISLERIDIVKNILPGAPSPQFTYKDNNGKEVSLKDLKGKTVYIDLWATWCVPCIAEIPTLKKLESDYRGKKVQFVSISIDFQRDLKKWLSMIKEKNLSGIQLFADKDWKSAFLKAYAVNSIPRFLLIDKNGNIISADAPRPSSEAELRRLIDENINK